MKMIQRISLLFILNLSIAATQCDLAQSSKEWMCSDCAALRDCSIRYGILNGCDADDLARFTTMYDLLIGKVPANELSRYQLTGTASCEVGATIAVTLSEHYGPNCEGGRVAVLNSAQTGMFCSCPENTICDTDYEEQQLNRLILTLTVLLIFHMAVNISQILYNYFLGKNKVDSGADHNTSIPWKPMILKP